MNLYLIGSALATASLYMLSASGNAICIKGGNINLGGEGQIYAGGFITAVMLNLFANYNINFLFALLLSIISAALFSALLAGLSALLQLYKNASFLLTSYIISAFTIPLIDGLITGPFRSNTTNLIATAFISEKYRFTEILPPSTLSPFIFIAILICILAGLFIFKTNQGKKISIYGIAAEFSKYAGFSIKKIELSTALISGALNGITGFAAICGIYYSCHQGFYSGIGWNSLSVAIISKLNPFLIIPVSIFMSFAITLADNYALFHNFDFDVSGLIQGIIIFIIAITMRKGAKK